MFSYEAIVGSTVTTPTANDAKRTGWATESRLMDYGFVLALGGIYGLRLACKVEGGKLSCGHRHWEVVVTLTLLFGTIVLKATAPSAPHAKLHERQLEKDLSEANIEGLDELQQMAASVGVPIEQIIDTVPEPLRSEMLSRIDKARLASAPDVTAAVTSDLDRIRKGE